MAQWEIYKNNCLINLDNYSNNMDSIFLNNNKHNNHNNNLNNNNNK